MTTPKPRRRVMATVPKKRPKPPPVVSRVWMGDGWATCIDEVDDVSPATVAAALSRATNAEDAARSSAIAVGRSYP